MTARQRPKSAASRSPGGLPALEDAGNGSIGAGAGIEGLVDGVGASSICANAESAHRCP